MKKLIVEQKLEKLGFEDVSHEGRNINEVYQKGKRWINLSTEQTGIVGDDDEISCRSYLAPNYIQKIFA